MAGEGWFWRGTGVRGDCSAARAEKPEKNKGTLSSILISLFYIFFASHVESSEKNSEILVRTCVRARVPI